MGDRVNAWIQILSQTTLRNQSHLEMHVFDCICKSWIFPLRITWSVEMLSYAKRVLTHCAEFLEMNPSSYFAQKQKARACTSLAQCVCGNFDAGTYNSFTASIQWHHPCIALRIGWQSRQVHLLVCLSVCFLMDLEKGALLRPSLLQVERAEEEGLNSRQLFTGHCNSFWRTRNGNSSRSLIRRGTVKRINILTHLKFILAA